jgi:hypothetical protein
MIISWRFFLFLSIIMINRGYRSSSFARKALSYHHQLFRVLSTKEPLEFGPSFQLPPAHAGLYLEKMNQHPNDSRLSFDARAHKYYFDGKQLKYSVTGVVKKYFEEFLPELAAERMIKSKNWPRPQYVHPDGQPYSVSDIVEEWESAGVIARNQGNAYNTLFYYTHSILLF